MVVISTMSTIYSTIIGRWYLRHRAKNLPGADGHRHRVSLRMRDVPCWPAERPRLTNVIPLELGGSLIALAARVVS